MDSGTVVALNRRKGFVAVQADDGYLVFELLGGYEVGLGDVIQGDFRSHGGETFVNRTKGERMDVFVQAIDCTPASMRNLMA
jgi:hypothetical protein